MKTFNRILFSFFLIAGWIAVNGQSTIDSQVPGDNFSLQGALELFKRSASPEEFEKLLNSPDSKVNNLDLNTDGNIDYIRVIDRNEGNVHAFVLQDVVSETESQDVAVIELQKLENGKATLQITGDADIYGVETIIEPTEEVRVNAGASTARASVNVWAWPSVQYVYGPYYNPWVSPWTWSYYPIWWRPWSPVAFGVYSPWWRPYYPYYSIAYSHRIGYLPYLYRPYRTTSMFVHNNYYNQINRYRSHSNGWNSYGSRTGGRTRNDGYGSWGRSNYQHHNYGRQEMGTYNQYNSRGWQNQSITNRSRGNTTYSPSNSRSFNQFQQRPSSSRSMNGYQLHSSHSFGNSSGRSMNFGGGSRGFGGHAGGSSHFGGGGHGRH